ncbi:hypothetical protein [Sphaerisporangium dianthi]|uniref:Uncharacterized protein n=1 Tax=Sphaerisporangium dianthi TaxID=1436120 RepID=A0ABV9C9B7_9ACTN
MADAVATIGLTFFTGVSFVLESSAVTMKPAHGVGRLDMTTE